MFWIFKFYIVSFFSFARLVQLYVITGLLTLSTSFRDSRIPKVARARESSPGNGWKVEACGAERRSGHLRRGILINSLFSTCSSYGVDVECFLAVVAVLFRYIFLLRAFRCEFKYPPALISAIQFRVTNVGKDSPLAPVVFSDGHPNNNGISSVIIK